MDSNDRNDTDRWLTPREAAEYLGYALQTIYNKVSRNEIPHHKRGNTTRFLKSELDAWMRGDPVNSA